MIVAKVRKNSEKQKVEGKSLGGLHGISLEVSNKIRGDRGNRVDRVDEVDEARVSQTYLPYSPYLPYLPYLPFCPCQPKLAQK